MDQNSYKDKFIKVLEEKGLLEDEVLSLASVARSYQSQAKEKKEDLEKLEASYHLICSQNSNLESELIKANMNCKLLADENEELKEQNQEYLAEICKLKDLLKEDTKSNAIKELSNIILSKEPSHDNYRTSAKYSEFIREALEGKIKSLEKERDDFIGKYRELLVKYSECLKELRNAGFLNSCDSQLVSDDDTGRFRASYLELEMEQTQNALDNLEFEEMSFCTSIAESPKISEEIFKKKNEKISTSINFMQIQAAAIERLLLGVR
jgi:hypothetical protein